MYRHWLACNSVLLLLLGIFFLEVFLGAFNTIWRYLWSISLCCPALLWRIPSRVAHPLCWRFASSSLGISFGITRLLFWGIFWTFFIAVFFQFQRVLGAGKHFLLVFSSLLYPRHQLGPTSLSFFLASLLGFLVLPSSTKGNPFGDCVASSTSYSLIKLHYTSSSWLLCLLFPSSPTHPSWMVPTFPYGK